MNTHKVLCLFTLFMTTQVMISGENELNKSQEETSNSTTENKLKSFLTPEEIAKMASAHQQITNHHTQLQGNNNLNSFDALVTQSNSLNILTKNIDDIFANVTRNLEDRKDIAIKNITKDMSELQKKLDAKTNVDAEHDLLSQKIEDLSAQSKHLKNLFNADIAIIKTELQAGKTALEDVHTTYTKKHNLTAERVHYETILALQKKAVAFKDAITNPAATDAVHAYESNQGDNTRWGFWSNKADRFKYIATATHFSFENCLHKQPDGSQKLDAAFKANASPEVLELFAVTTHNLPNNKKEPFTITNGLLLCKVQNGYKNIQCTTIEKDFAAMHLVVEANKAEAARLKAIKDTADAEAAKAKEEAARLNALEHTIITTSAVNGEEVSTLPASSVNPDNHGDNASN